jgi:hypothetical protein
MLQPFTLSYVVIGDSVVITSEEMGVYRQMKQRVEVNVDKTPLDAVLKKLAKTYGINVVIDPKVAKEAQAPVTLQVEDTSLENAVRLLAELAGVKSVQVGNVLLVTDEAKATKIRKEDKGTQPGPTTPYYYGGVVRGIGGPPPLALPPVKVMPPRVQEAPIAPPKALPPRNPNAPAAPPINRNPGVNPLPSGATTPASPPKQDPSR